MPEILLVVSFLLNIIALVYGIFMIIYLNDASTCDKYLTKRDSTFRKVALVVSWIDVVLTGLVLLGLLAVMISGTNHPVVHQMFPKRLYY